MTDQPDHVFPELEVAHPLVARAGGVGKVEDEDVGTRAAHERVAPLAAVEGVGAVAAHEQVVARAATDEVVAGVAMGGVVAVAGADGIVARAAAQQVVRRAAAHGVVAVTAHHRVAFVAAGQRVVARAAQHRVRAVAARGGVLVGAGVDQVVAGAAADHVVARAAEQDVVAVAAAETVVAEPAVAHVVALVQRDVVVVVAAVDGVVARAAQQRVVALPAKNHVVAEPAVEEVVRRHAVDHVMAVGAGQVVEAGGAHDGGQRRDPRQAVERVGAIGEDEALDPGEILDAGGGAHHHHVAGDGDVAGHRRHVEHGGVCAVAAEDHVAAAAALERVVVQPAHQRVVTGIAVHHVAAVVRPGDHRAADDDVVAGAAVHGVHRAARLDPVVARIAPEHVDPEPAEDRVVPRPAVDGIPAEMAGETVVGVVAEDLDLGVVERERGVGRHQDVVEAGEKIGGAGGLVGGGSGGKIDGVDTVVLDQQQVGVGADAAVQHVARGGARERVVAAVAVQRVGALAAEQPVVAAVAREAVIARAAEDRVGAARPDHAVVAGARVVAVVAAEQVEGVVDVPADHVVVVLGRDLGRAAGDHHAADRALVGEGHVGVVGEAEEDRAVVELGQADAHLVVLDVLVDDLAAGHDLAGLGIEDRDGDLGAGEDRLSRGRADIGEHNLPVAGEGEVEELEMVAGDVEERHLDHVAGGAVGGIAGQPGAAAGQVDRGEPVVPGPHRDAEVRTLDVGHGIAHLHRRADHGAGGPVDHLHPERALVGQPVLGDEDLADVAVAQQHRARGLVLVEVGIDLDRLAHGGAGGVEELAEELVVGGAGIVDPRQVEAVRGGGKPEAVDLALEQCQQVAARAAVGVVDLRVERLAVVVPGHQEAAVGKRDHVARAEGAPGEAARLLGDRGDGAAGGIVDADEQVEVGMVVDHHDAPVGKLRGVGVLGEFAEKAFAQQDLVAGDRLRRGGAAMRGVDLRGQGGLGGQVM